MYNLIEKLNKVKDSRYRNSSYSIGVVLTIVLMATIGGYTGYRSIGYFTKRYKKELLEFFELETERLPSYSTIRRVLMRVDSLEIIKIYEEWISASWDKKSGTWISIDGKAIRGTKDKDQKMIQLVSMFRHDSKEVVSLKQCEDKSNEIPIVRELVKESNFENMVFTLDAMHTQAETIEVIKDSGNDAVIQLKKTKKHSLNW